MTSDSQDRFSRKPLFVQVRDALLERISQGEWRPGMALPNEIELARAMGVSAGTVRKALDALETDHVVSRRQGRGTFVNDPTSAEFAFRFHRLRTAAGGLLGGDFSDVEVSQGTADETERRRLQLAAGDRVFRIQRTRRVVDRAFMLEFSSLPEAVFPGLLERSSSPHLVRDAAPLYAIILSRAQEQVSPTAATGEIAAKLGVSAGTPVLVLDRVICSSEGAPVEWRLAYCDLGDGYYQADLA